jgi:hypothetical protein
MTIAKIIDLLGLSVLVVNSKVQITKYFEHFCIKVIDAPLTIGWNVEVSLRCVDGSLGKDLSTMFFYFSLRIYDGVQIEKDGNATFTQTVLETIAGKTFTVISEVIKLTPLPCCPLNDGQVK